MSMRSLALVAVFVMNFRLCHGKRYDDYALYNVRPVTVDHVNYLQSLRSNKSMEVIFWNSPNLQSVSVMVHHKDEVKFMDMAEIMAMTATPVLRNVQTAFDHQVVVESALHEYKNKWEFIRSLNSIYDWMKEFTDQNKDNCELVSIGKSAENRNILAFSYRKDKLDKDKPMIVIEAGAHGNEWIATAVATYIMDQLVNSNFSPLLDLKHAYNWFIIPLLNPDGYEYSQKEDRLWKKNRRKTVGASIGVDLNRNFDFRYGYNDAGVYPDDENYRGLAPLSEPEAKALKRVMDQYKDKIVYYISIHGFGQKIIVPNTEDDFDLFNVLRNYARQASFRISKYRGRRYDFGTPSEVLGHEISGDTMHWAKNKYHVPYVYTILPRDDGLYGHALHDDEILPACREVMLGVIELMQGAPPRRYYKLAEADDGDSAAPQAVLLIFTVMLLLLS